MSSLYYNLLSLHPNETEANPFFFDIPKCIDRNFTPNLGESLLQRWDPHVFAFHHNASNQLLDFPRDLGMKWHCVSQRMREVMESFPEMYVEFLPIRLRNSVGEQIVDGYSLLNYLCVVDAVDKRNSRLEAGEDDFILHDGEYLSIERLVLSGDRLVHPVCRVVGCGHLRLYREDVVDAFAKAQITGCRFEKVELS